MSETLAVAALSARLMAESARRAGFRVVAMDVFGDVDTTRASSGWHRIGEPTTMRLDAARTIGALESFAREVNAIGWIAGSGFESIHEVVVRGAGIVPLIGNAPDITARVRDPGRFFERLAALGVPHPPTSLAPPPTPGDWLVKDSTGSGAWHIRPASDDTPVPRPGRYYQRRMPGRALGALFVADRRRARVVGVSEQTIRARHGHPYVYCGIVGPVGLPAAVAARIEDAVQAIVADMQLAGLNSLDLLLDGDAFHVLEVNPRPSSGLALYDAAYEGGLMRAHVAAARDGRLPSPASIAAPNGCEIVFADACCRATPATVERMLEAGWCHDVAQPGTRFTPGEPVCTVSAQAESIDDVRALLERRRARVAAWLSHCDG